MGTQSTLNHWVVAAGTAAAVVSLSFADDFSPASYSMKWIDNETRSSLQANISDTISYRVLAQNANSIDMLRESSLNERDLNLNTSHRLFVQVRKSSPIEFVSVEDENGFI